ncbi:hypothetical protein AB0L00_23540 [Actinoallomurus sp. NPDC052308]|uniref:hypothetical protein n=1 Tax=Actinoallomurus sp. NPDC052308 TaxID=3155530 RepID=UPI003426DFA0
MPDDLDSEQRATPPFEGATAGAVLVAVATDDPAPMTAAGALAPVISALLHKDPAQRPTADALQAMLTRIAPAAPNLSPPAPAAVTAIEPPLSPADHAPPMPGPVPPHPRPAPIPAEWVAALRRISTEFLSLAGREDRLDVETQLRNLSLDYFELAQADDTKSILADRSAVGMESELLHRRSIS